MKIEPGMVFRSPQNTTPKGVELLVHKVADGKVYYTVCNNGYASYDNEVSEIFFRDPYCAWKPAGRGMIVYGCLVKTPDAPLIKWRRL